MVDQESLVNLSEGQKGQRREIEFHFPPPAVCEKRERGERDSSFSLRSMEIG